MIHKADTIYDFSDEYNFGAGDLLRLAKNHISSKLPFASARNLGKARVLANTYGAGFINRGTVSVLANSPVKRYAINMILSSRYDYLIEKIRKDGRSRGLRGPALGAYVRKVLKEGNLRRYS